jgi:hypothetical protein
MDGVVTLTPCTPTAEIEINGQPIVQTTILRDHFMIRIGRSHVFRFFEHGAQVMFCSLSLIFHCATFHAKG